MTTAGKQHISTPEQLLERFKELDIEKGALLPLVSPECMYGVQSNDEILDICAEHPDRFVPFCNLDPRAVSFSSSAPLDIVLDHFKKKGCRGIGEITANIPFLDPMTQNLFRHAQSAGLPVIFHVAARIGETYGLYDEPGLPGLEMSLLSFPKLKFLGHSPGFWSEISRLDTPADRWFYPKYPVKEEGVVPKLMRRHPNLYGDLSAGSGHNALARDPEYASRFLTEFQDRLLFGTDICAPDTPAPLVEFLLKMRGEGGISEEVFRKVSRENAVRVLGL